MARARHDARACRVGSFGSDAFSRCRVTVFPVRRGVSSETKDIATSRPRIWWYEYRNPALHRWPQRTRTERRMGRQQFTHEAQALGLVRELGRCHLSPALDLLRHGVFSPYTPSGRTRHRGRSPKPLSCQHSHRPEAKTTARGRRIHELCPSRNIRGQVCRRHEASPLPAATNDLRRSRPARDLRASQHGPLTAVHSCKTECLKEVGDQDIAVLRKALN